MTEKKLPKKCCGKCKHYKETTINTYQKKKIIKQEFGIGCEIRNSFVHDYGLCRRYEEK